MPLQPESFGTHTFDSERRPSPPSAVGSKWRFAYLALAAGCLLAAPVTQANNGLNMPGYGARALGMGGVSIALPQDSLAAANNPAGMALVGSRFDAGVSVIDADIDLDVAGNHYHDATLPIVPDLGYNQRLAGGWSAGVSLIGNGVELNYGEPVIGYGTSDLKSKLQQAIALPTLSREVAPGHFVGVSAMLGVQRLSIGGVENLGINDPDADWATGYGASVGYLGQLSPQWQVGATYRTPMRFSRFNEYRQLIPEGRVDMPQQAGAGVAFMPNEQLTLALDVMWIGWSQEHTWGNAFTEGGVLGARNGAGFGWQDQRVVRFGANYAATPEWALRAGASFASELVEGSESTLSALAPLMARDHYSVGATYTLDSGIELNGALLHMPDEMLSGEAGSRGIDIGIGLNMMSLGIGVPL